MVRQKEKRQHASSTLKWILIKIKMAGEKLPPNEAAKPYPVSMTIGELRAALEQGRQLLRR